MLPPLSRRYTKFLAEQPLGDNYGFSVRAGLSTAKQAKLASRMIIGWKAYFRYTIGSS